MFKEPYVLCFFSCYLLAFLFELTSLRARNVELMRKISRQLLTIGIIVHSVVLFKHGVLQNARFFSSGKDWFFALAFAAALSTFVLSVVYKKTPFNFFFLPLILLVLILSDFAWNATFSQEATCRFVRMSHAVSLLLATLCSFIGAIIGTMFFIQRKRLKNKMFHSRISLPSLEWLGYGVRHSANVSILFLGIGVTTGFSLNLLAPKDESGTFIWRDPVVLGATLLFVLSLLALAHKLWFNNTDVNAKDAAFSLIECAVLVILLLFATFSYSHWQGLNSNRYDSKEDLSNVSLVETLR